jgi:hypothetical protein
MRRVRRTRSRARSASASASSEATSPPPGSGRTLLVRRLVRPCPATHGPVGVPANRRTSRSRRGDHCYTIGLAGRSCVHRDGGEARFTSRELCTCPGGIRGRARRSTSVDVLRSADRAPRRSPGLGRARPAARHAPRPAGNDSSSARRGAPAGPASRPLTSPTDRRSLSRPPRRGLRTVPVANPTNHERTRRRTVMSSAPRIE